MLELKNISKTFNKGTINAKLALDNLSLTLNDGDFVTVIGGNGAGKSTMLNAIAGVFFVDEGTIKADDVDLTNMPDYKRATMLGRVFQDPMKGTNPQMMIEENMALALRRGQRRGLKWGITKDEREMFYHALKGLNLGLEDRLTTKVGLLSGGQRQALTLLMATLKKPKVLYMSDKVVEENHLTTMMVTHNMRDAITHGNRLIMMDAGHIVVDISGEDKKKLTVPDLLDMFSKASGSTEANDAMLLSK